jgi:rhomboid protease GluP
VKQEHSPSMIWAASILLVWILVATVLNQPIWDQQHSRDLVAFGAIKGADFSAIEAWRLVASQWLHVKPQHMLLNVVIIGGVGLAAEKRLGRTLPVIVGLAGGAAGQLTAVLTEPQAFISGASQAYLALCGLAIITKGVDRAGLWLAWIGLAIALALDIFVSGHGMVKPGHLAGLVTGLTAGGLLRVRARQG